MYKKLINFLREYYTFRWSGDDMVLPIRGQLERIVGRRQDLYFVQIGSNDGVHGDPLCSMIKRNTSWKGIFVEPVDYLFSRLKQNYGYAERFVFEKAAIGPRDQSAAFYYVSEKAKEALGDTLPDWYDQLGSFSRDHIIKHMDGILEPYIVEERMQCVHLQDLLDKQNVKRVDLLHVDTEGFDFVVLSQFDFRKYRPYVVLYEHKHLAERDQKKARSLLRKAGYIQHDYSRGDSLAILPGQLW